MLILVGLALVAAACGDDDSSDQSGLVNDVAQQVSGDGEFDFSNEQAVCVAEGMIDGLGADRIVEGLDTDFDTFMSTASEPERRAVVDTLLDCVNFGTLLFSEAEGQISEDSARCLGNAFSDSETFRSALTESLATGQDPFDHIESEEEFITFLFECLSAEEIVRLGDS